MASEINLEIERTVQKDKSLAKEYEKAVTIQKKIEAMKLNGEKISPEMIANPVARKLQEMQNEKRPGDFKAALFFLTPNFIGFLVFVAFPVVFSIAMAFTNWDLALHNPYRQESIVVVWLRNFIDLMQTPDFWKYFGNTLFLMMSIPLGIAGSLFLAVMLTRKLKSDSRRTRFILMVGSLLSFFVLGAWLYLYGYGLIALILSVLGGVVLAIGFMTGDAIYRTLFYLPSFTAGVAVFLLWKQMYNPLSGPINSALSPVLNVLSDIVNSTHPIVWQLGGYFLWGVAVILIARFGWTIFRNLRLGDIGFGTALLSVASLIVLGLIMYGFGKIAIKLPTYASDGLTPPQWLTDVDWAKPAIMIMGLWLAVGSNNMLLYIAGISNIPPELYEAADIDGAGGWQKFWNITWPQLAPTTFFIVVMSLIGGLQGGFEQARTMTQGGPYGATTTLSYYIYSEGFETGRLGYASAISWVMFVMIFIITMINYRFGSRYVNE